MALNGEVTNQFQSWSIKFVAFTYRSQGRMFWHMELAWALKWSTDFTDFFMLTEIGRFCNIFFQEKPSLGRESGISSVPGTGNTPTEPGPTEQQPQATGKQRGQTSPFTRPWGEFGRLEWRRRWCFTRAEPRKVSRPTGSCTSTG